MTVFGAFFVENFLLLTLIAVHVLTLSFLPFSLLPFQHTFGRCLRGKWRDMDKSSKKKIRIPLRIVLISPYSSPDDKVQFPGI